MSTSQPWILGVSSAFHSGAACLLKGSRIVAAMQEERLTRHKRERIDPGRRSLAIDYCLRAGGIRPRDLSMVVDCSILGPADDGPRPRHGWLVDEAGGTLPVVPLAHHAGHAIGAFATSGWRESLVLVVDGGGSFGWQLPPDERAAAVDFDSAACEHATLYLATDGRIVPVEKHMSRMRYLLEMAGAGMPPFASLGHVFSSAAMQIFGDYLEAGKVMGLAPYGRITMPAEDFFTFDGRFNFSDAVPSRFTDRRRWPDAEDAYRNLAASAQHALERGIGILCARARRHAPGLGLAYAGGVALNSVANQRVVARAGFRRLHVMSAADDAGTAIGAAYHGLSRLEGRLTGRRLRNDRLGRPYAARTVDAAIRAAPGAVRIRTRALERDVARLLAGGAIVGWFQGGAEFGPRALGGRSILCDPRRPDGKRILNERVKFRERFRPFAPVILEDAYERWFTGRASPPMRFMLEVADFKPAARARVPSVVHVDGTGRVQTVSRAHHPRFHALLECFHELTGVPMLLNTSLNVMGEPLVETPSDALRCLLLTGLDYCVLNDRLVGKATATSVLDLVPVSTATRTGRGEDVSVEYVARTEHGPVTRTLHPALAALVDGADGVRTAREIAAAAAAPVSEASWHVLLRYSLVSLTAGP